MNIFVGLDKGRWRLTAAWLCLGTGVSAAAAALLVGLKAMPDLAPPPIDTIYDPALQTAMTERGDLLSRALPAMTVTVDGRREELNDCQDFLWVVRFKSARAQLMADPASARFADCAPVELLNHARRPSNFLAPEDQLGRLLADRLDLASLDDGMVASLLPQSVAANFGGVARLAALPVGQLGIEARAVTVADGRANWRIEAVASVDLERNGLEKLLLKITRRDVDPAKPQGVGYAVVRQGEDGRLHAERVETLLLPTSKLPWWASVDMVT